MAVFDLAVENQNGRANIQALMLNIFKGFMATSLVTVLPIELFKFCITLQNTFSHDLIRIFAGHNQNTGSIALLAGSVLTQNFTAVSLMSLLLMIAFGYCIVKLFLGLLTWPSDMILAIGVMLAANEVPRIAQSFGLETSSKANLMGVVYATQSAINLTKNIGNAVAK